MNLYMAQFIKKKDYKFTKKIKNDKNLDDIICRSSGPSMISAYKADKYFGIGRVNKNLVYCVYSKSFYVNFLKKRKYL